MPVDVRASVLEEARVALRLQAEDLKAVRDRCGQLMTYAAAVAALLGGLALRGEDASPSGFTVAAGVAFSVVAFCVVWISLPVTLIFANDARVMVDKWDLDTIDPDHFADQLAACLADNHEANQTAIDVLFRIYSIASAAFAVETGLLVLDLVRR